jgi:hypothetical protein
MIRDFFKLHFDDQGHLLNVTEREAITSSLVDTIEPVTDLWIFSHGWNTDEKGADATYDTWVGRMQERIRQEIINSPYNPSFVGIYWPSMAWSGDIAKSRAPLWVSPVANPGDSLDRGEFELGYDKVEMSGTSGEFELGASDITLEMGRLEALSAVNLSGEMAGKARFVEEYRAAMDPRGEHSSWYNQDFARLYELLFQSQQPDNVQIEEFVQILQQYKVDDPHSDLVESINVLNTLEEVEAYLKAERALSSHEGFEPDNDNILLRFFRIFTFWAMKGRAAVVGQNGVAVFLRDLKRILQQHKRNVRLHLFGHSFGAKLVSATVHGLANTTYLEPPVVDTLILLLGAFSQFSFSNNISAESGGIGYYSSLIDLHLVTNPIVTIYSQYDLANKEMYPLGMRLADRNKIYELGDSNDRFGAIGANGAQGLDNTYYRVLEMLSLKESYNWSDLTSVALLNVDGQRYINANKDKRPIGAHGDTDRPEIFHLALAASRSL